jgi:uncharacterized membrane protein
MNWYLVVKFLHILAVALTIGGMFARQLIRGFARKNDELNAVASLTRAAVRIDRMLVIPWSNIMIAMGILLAVMQKWPVFGFLQGASKNWLLVSNILLVIMLILIGAVFVPYNMKVEALLESALAQGSVTPELTATLADRRNNISHLIEETLILAVAALMVLKPF